jgi:hypothetical protein
MDLSLASTFIDWFLYVDPSCIVCSWDPTRAGFPMQAREAPLPAQPVGACLTF